MEVGKALNVLAKRFSFIAPLPTFQAPTESMNESSESQAAMPL